MTVKRGVFGVISKTQPFTNQINQIDCLSLSLSLSLISFFLHLPASTLTVVMATSRSSSALIQAEEEEDIVAMEDEEEDDTCHHQKKNRFHCRFFYTYFLHLINLRQISCLKIIWLFSLLAIL